jgi:diketogulonate reductase-like aldo/keto reductase
MPRKWQLTPNIQLHPFCQQKAVVEYCQKHGIVLEAYCPIIRGEMDHPVFHEIAKKVTGLSLSLWTS